MKMGKVHMGRIESMPKDQEEKKEEEKKESVQPSPPTKIPSSKEDYD